MWADQVIRHVSTGACGREEAFCTSKDTPEASLVVGTYSTPFQVTSRSLQSQSQVWFAVEAVKA